MGSPNPNVGVIVPLAPDSASMPSGEGVSNLAAFAAGLAHEVNNPLAYILTNLDFAREQLPKNCDADVMAALEEARLGALRIGAIMRGLQIVASGEAMSDEELGLGEVAEPASALFATTPRLYR